MENLKQLKNSMAKEISKTNKFMLTLAVAAQRHKGQEQGHNGFVL